MQMHFKINISKLNFTCDTLYHNLFFISLIMDVNLYSNWLPCAQCELELEFIPMCIKLITKMHISLWKFHNDKCMLSNLLFNSLTSKEEKNEISHIRVAFLFKL
jgi:hypothetical protein